MFNFVPMGYCINQVVGPDVKPTDVHMHFTYCKESCGKFREYPGLDLCLLKHADSILVVSDNQVFDANSMLVKNLQECFNLSSLELLFEPNKPFSKHAICVTYCDGSNLTCCDLPIERKFLVYRQSILTRKGADDCPEESGKRLKVESLGIYDSMVRSVGGPNSKIILPTYISNALASRLWDRGYGIRLVNTRLKGNEIVLRKMK